MKKFIQSSFLILSTTTFYEIPLLKNVDDILNISPVPGYLKSLERSLSLLCRLHQKKYAQKNIFCLFK